MEDVKWLIKKGGLPLLAVFLIMIAGVFRWDKLHTDNEKVPEAVWEPPVEISNNESISTEDNDVEDSVELPYWSVPQANEALLSEREQEQLQSQVLVAAEQVSVVYKEVEIIDAPNYTSGVNEFTTEQSRAVVEELGKLGLVSVGENINMQNYKAIEKFYGDFLNSHDSMATIFDVHRDGLIGTVTFVHRQGELQTYYIGIRWKEGGVPEIQGISVSNIAEIKLTEKGYLIYAYEKPMAHASLRQYWRIKPLSKKCRDLTEKYISGLSYVNYNMLVTNWDSSNVEDILIPCMFEDIYRIYAGESLQTENWKIPAEQYEQIMTTYFPVSVEQLREHCKYDVNSNCYEREMLYSCPYPPFGEVVDYTENVDGTITLIVDGVWADYNSDCAFTNQIVVQPFENGTFRYLSNFIEEKELEIPSIGRIKG